MNFARRELMKFMGLAPIAAPMAKAALMEELASPSVKAALALAPVLATSGEARGYQVAGESAGEKIFGKVLHRRLQLLLDQAHTRQNIIDSIRRANRLDPDIEALKSCSRTYKVAKQMERDLEEGFFLDRAHNMIWEGKGD